VKWFTTQEGNCRRRTVRRDFIEMKRQRSRDACCLRSGARVL
jgi:hypothetical protein